MAGKEFSGIEHADAKLFEGAVWLITPIVNDQQYTPPQEEFTSLLGSIGARVVVLDPERHDVLCAWISHLPQMISTALTSVLHEELGDDEIVMQIGGRALREMTRIAHSPYSMWRDIALTNSENIEDVMLRFEQQLTHLRENLRGRSCGRCSRVRTSLAKTPNSFATYPSADYNRRFGYKLCQ